MSQAKLDLAMERLLRPQLKQLSAYHVPSASGMIKLDAMENPYELPTALRAEWTQQLQQVAINRYPDPNSAELKKAIRVVTGVADDVDIMLGNGSDELIQIIAMLAGGPGRRILSVTPSFSMYELISKTTSSDFQAIALQNDFSLDQRVIVDAIENSDPDCVFIAYPNNPTGNCFDEDTINRILQSASGLVVIDEAYFAFCQKSWLDRLADYPNLIILRTFSKSGLAGLRLGMLFANPAWVAQMEKLRLPYNINSLTQHAAHFCLQHHDLLQSQANQIVSNRAELQNALDRIPGMIVYPSEANFVLIRVADANSAHQFLSKGGILVKNLHATGSPLENCLRLTVGTPEQNQAMVQCFQQFYNG